ncbi:M28 family peptidase [Deltaproteobacteria bacterium TL4]
MKFKRNTRMFVQLVGFVFVFLGACYRDSTTQVPLASDEKLYRIGGFVRSISGTVNLQNNESDFLEIRSEGSFTFEQPLANGSTYQVTIKQKSENLGCELTHETGVVENKDVDDIEVSCGEKTRVTFKGVVVGLDGSLTLQTSTNEMVFLEQNGNFEATLSLVEGFSYIWGIFSQPESQVCRIENGSGIVSINNNTEVLIFCDPTSIQNSWKKAYAHMVYLSKTLGKRVAGSANDVLAKDYITHELEKIGYEVRLQTFRLESISQRQRGVELTPSSSKSFNIIAKKAGTASETLIVGGHYDSVQECGGTGASDNASGMGILLEIARQLYRKTLPISVEFIAFGAEEKGLQGSEYFVNNRTAQELENTVAMINLDTLAGGDKLYVHGGTAPSDWVKDQALKSAEETGNVLHVNPGFNKSYPKGTTGLWSDHAAFAAKGIPFAVFEATNWDIGDQDGFEQTETQGAIWHTDKDALEFIEAAFPGRIEKQLKITLEILNHWIPTFQVQKVARTEKIRVQADFLQRSSRYPAYRLKCD